MKLAIVAGNIMMDDANMGGITPAVLIFSGSIGFCHVYKFFHIDTSKKP